MLQKLKLLCILLVANFTQNPESLFASQAEFSGECIVALDGALAANYNGQKTEGFLLNLHLTIESGVCVDAFATAPDFNVMVHELEVNSLAITNKRMELEVSVTVNKDRWIGGGKAEYKVRLDRKPSEEGLYAPPANPLLRTTVAREVLEGSFEGWFQAREVWKDKDYRLWTCKDAFAYGLILSDRTLSSRSRAPIRERPRMLVRQYDLPALREKFKTPFGRAFKAHFEQSTNPMAAGLLYQLTQNPRHAQRCYEQIIEFFKFDQKVIGEGRIPKMRLLLCCVKSIIIKY